MTETLRAAVVGKVADYLIGRRVGHPLRVAVDGVTAAGKTTLANELATAVDGCGRMTIRISVDGFHNPRAYRHRQGRDSAVGYYLDAYNFGAFAEFVLTPLGPDGDRRYRSAVHNLATDEAVDRQPVEAPVDAILVVDGSFLQSAALAGLWDEVVYVDTSLAAARVRGVTRDTDLLGGVAAAEHAYEHRYHAASQLYLAECAPAESATVVIGNDDIAHPILRRCG